MNKNAGVAYLVISTILISFQGVFVKQISHVSSFQIVFYRSLIMFIINYEYHKFQNINIYHKQTDIQICLILRGFFGIISYSCLIFCIQISLISEIYSIVYLSPIWTAILARIILKEQFTIFEFFSTFFGLLGMILSLKPPFLFPSEVKSESSLSSRILSLFNSLLLSFVYIAMGKIKGKANAWTTSQYLNIFGLLIPPIALLQWNSEKMIVLNFYEWGYIIACAVFAQFGQLAFARGMQLEYAAKACIVNFLSIPFGYLYEILIFGNSKKITKLDLIGSFFIFLATGIIFFKNWYLMKKLQKSPQSSTDYQTNIYNQE